MALVGQWDDLLAALPDGWGAAHLRLELEPGADTERAAALLGPLQPARAGERTLALRIARDGSGPGPEMARRLVARLDEERLHGRLETVSVSEAAPPETAPATPSLAGAFADALATLPADWSDLLAEVELASSDDLERAALQMAPLNPRRDGARVALRFRAARRFGYGASTTMVRRCLERCDEHGIRGGVRILQVLSGTMPVQTQGPGRLLSGRAV